MNLYRVLESGERLGLGPDDPTRQTARDERTRDLENLAEAVRGDEADASTLALEDRVGRDRRTVQD
jgi:hypothetical protein